MTKGIYVIRDERAETSLGGPLVFPHHAVAVRFFGDLAKDPQSAINKHLNDHTLLYIGTYDEETCVIIPTESVQVILTGEAWAATQAQAQS